MLLLASVIVIFGLILVSQCADVLTSRPSDKIDCGGRFMTMLAMSGVAFVLLSSGVFYELNSRIKNLEDAINSRDITIFDLKKELLTVKGMPAEAPDLSVCSADKTKEND